MIARCRYVLIIALVSGCAYKAAPTPTAPTATTPAPASIALTSTRGLGASGDQAFVVAIVDDANGRHVPNAPVTFESSASGISPTAIETDLGGMARATVTGRAASVVTARVGAVSAALDLAANPIINVTPIPVPFIPPPPTPTPIPQPTPTPRPDPTPTPFTVFVSVIAQGDFRQPVMLVLSTLPMSMPLVRADIAWGDGATDNGLTDRLSHVYASAGWKTVTVFAVASNGQQSLNTAQIELSGK